MCVRNDQLEFDVIYLPPFSIKVLLTAVALLWLHSSQAAGPHLLISKVILNEYTVQGKDLTIRYSLYNIGEG